VAFFGDGAVNNGAFHEGLNMAAIWDLPVLFVCENNMYATEIAFAYATKNQDVAARASTYGMAAVGIDGNDVLAVYQAAEEAVARARAGNGPTLIECKTYRTRAHAEGMRDAGYRTVEEIESWRQRDPVTCFKDKLIAAGKAAEANFTVIDTEIKTIADEAIEFAKSSPYPDPATVTEHIFSS
jgi:2-oxoisovalerate dehydrogenase E1 component